MSSNFRTLDLPSQPGALRTIFWSCLVAGLLDAAAGTIVYYAWFGFNPFQVLQFIASGVYGPSAINGGKGMVFLGLLFHFIIALVAAAVYFFLYPVFRVPGKYRFATGLIYGLGIWLLMNLLVLPHSNIPRSDFDPRLAAIGILWHMVLVGLPIALITHKYYRWRL